MSRASIALAAALALLAAGCAHYDDRSFPITHSGALSSSDATVGAVLKGDMVAVYVCGGPTTFETHTRWFEGSVDDLATGLSTDGWTLSATKNESMIGKPLVGQLVSPTGTLYSFSLPTAAAGSVAGLYSAIDSGCRTGVVVTEGVLGQDPQLQGVWCNAAGDVDQVTPGEAIALENGALTVAVDGPNGVRELEVFPFVP